MEEIEINNKDYSWNWDDDNMLGHFQVKCQCGEILKNNCLEISEDELICPKCNWTYYVKRVTRVFGFPPINK